MYYVIEGPFRMVAGYYCGDLLTFTWSVRVLQRRENLILVVSQLSLFIYDILEATGCILNIRWVHNGIVEAGSYCTTQGIIEQIGELGVAMVTLVCTSPCDRRWLFGTPIYY